MRDRLPQPRASEWSPGRSNGPRTSLFSRGVPLIGTNAFTGNDSGCSGMLSPDQRLHGVVA